MEKNYTKALIVFGARVVAVISAFICVIYFSYNVLQLIIHRKMIPWDFRYVVISEEDKTCCLTKYHGSRYAEIRIPETIDGYTVVQLGDRLLQGCNNITGEVNIPDTVTVIGNCAFANCIGLTGTLNFSEGLRIIGYSAFENCTGLTGGLDFPDGLKRIGAAAFAGCSGIVSEIDFPEEINFIGKYAFSDCYGLYGSVEWPENITQIQAGVFEECSGLNGSLTLPEGIVDIGADAFEGCKFIGDLIIPDSVMKIGAHAFDGSFCNGKLVLSSNVVYIGSYAFSGCGLEGELILPKGVQLSEGAFKNCNFSGELVLPSTEWRASSYYTVELIFDIEDFDNIIDNYVSPEVEEKEQPVIEINLEAQQKSIKYDENTGCICGEIEIFEYKESDKGKTLRPVVSEEKLFVVFESVGYDEKHFVVTPALYMEDNVYYFEINASEFAGYERYQVNVSPYKDYISQEYMFEVLNEKYNLPEGIITNSPSVYIHYSGDGILYIRMK